MKSCWPGCDNPHSQHDANSNLQKNPNKRPLKVSYRTFIFNFVANLVSVQHQRKMQFVIKGCGRKRICVDKVIFILSKGEYTRSYCFKLF